MLFNVTIIDKFTNTNQAILLYYLSIAKLLQPDRLNIWRFGKAGCAGISYAKVGLMLGHRRKRSHNIEPTVLFRVFSHRIYPWSEVPYLIEPSFAIIHVCAIPSSNIWLSSGLFPIAIDFRPPRCAMRRCRSFTRQVPRADFLSAMHFGQWVERMCAD